MCWTLRTTSGGTPIGITGLAVMSHRPTARDPAAAATSAATTLNAKNLKARGARRLAELLMDISRGNAATQRRLRLELAGADSPAAVAKAVRTQLATIARASTFVDWQHRRAVVDDLPLQRRAIVDTVAPRDPVAGLDLMWRFLALAGSVFARCEDSSGTVIGVFDAAGSDLGQNPNSRRLVAGPGASSARHRGPV